MGDDGLWKFVEEVVDVFRVSGAVSVVDLLLDLGALITQSCPRSCNSGQVTKFGDSGRDREVEPFPKHANGFRCCPAMDALDGFGEDVVGGFCDVAWLEKELVDI